VTTVEIAVSGANGVKVSSDGTPVFNCQFDSKDTAGLGMMAASKASFACRKISATSFEVTGKLDGKPMYVDVYTVSADGKTLTDSGTPVNAKTEPYKFVFDRAQ
jgi:DNA-binding beta-propeller fold protein YncE